MPYIYVNFEEMIKKLDGSVIQIVLRLIHHILFAELNSFIQVIPLLIKLVQN